MLIFIKNDTFLPLKFRDLHRLRERKVNTAAPSPKTLQYWTSKNHLAETLRSDFLAITAARAGLDWEVLGIDDTRNTGAPISVTGSRTISWRNFNLFIKRLMKES
jgi:hypothetical protein